MVNGYWYSYHMKKKTSLITTLKITIYKKINNLIKSKFFIGFLYRLYFGILGCIRQGFWVNLTREGQYYVINESFNNKEKIKWFFPISLRYRCL